MTTGVLLEKQGKVVRSGAGEREGVRRGVPLLGGRVEAPSPAVAARERAIRDTFKI